VDRDEVDNRLDEHAEHLALRVVEHAREDLGHFLQVRLTAPTQQAPVTDDETTRRRWSSLRVRPTEQCVFIHRQTQSTDAAAERTMHQSRIN